MYKKFILIFAICSFLGNFSNVYSQAANWAFGIGSSASEFARNVTVDKFSNKIITGYFNGQNVDFDPSSNSSFYLNSNGDFDIFVAKYNRTGKFVKAFNIGGPGHDAGLSVTTDTLGNIYVTGWFRGQADFDPGPGVAILTSHGDDGTDYGYNGECFLAKYDSNLNYKWAFNIGGSTINDCGLKVRVDKNNNVYLCGTFTGVNVDFNPGADTAYLTSSNYGNRTSGFLAKYTSSGKYKSAVAFGGENGLDAEVRDFQFGSDGSIYLTGLYGGTIDLNPGTAEADIASNGTVNFFVEKLNKRLQYVWGFGIGGIYTDPSWAMGIDQYDNLYVTGQMSSSSIDFDPGAGTALVGSNGADDIFVAKYDKNGNYIFAQGIGSSGEDIGYDIFVKSNQYMITGLFSATVNFNKKGATNNLMSIGGTDIFVARYNLSGQYLNSFSVGSAYDDDSYSIASIEKNNYFTICGSFQGLNVDFDPSAGQLLLSSNGYQDAFVGNYYWTGSSLVAENEFNPTILSAIQIFPNPVTGNLVNIVLPRQFENEDFSMQIFDRAGKLMTEKKYANSSKTNNIQFTVGSWPAGNYLLKIIDKNGNVASGKFIK